MTNKPKKLSDTARALLTVAVTRDDYLVSVPRLPVAAARQVIRSMLNAALVEEVPALIEDATFAWRTGEDGRLLMLRATTSGLGQIADVETAAAPDAAHEPAAGTDGSGTVTAMPSTSGASLASATQLAAADPAQVPRVAHTMAVETTRLGKLHQAAQTLLDAWDNRAESLEDLTAAAATLRTTLAATAAAPPTIDHSRSRPETKRAQVLAMLALSGGRQRAGNR
jgi:hypothetical protein